jgi:hypothetical protein
MSALPPDDEERRLRELANRLHAERPAPAMAFRTRVLRRLQRRGIPRGRPARLWPLAGACAAAGVALLAAAASLA